MNPSVIEELKKIGISGFTLANNHIMDFGPSGLIETINHIQQYGLKSCGAGLNISDAYKPMIFEGKNGYKIGIFSFCEQEFGVTQDDSPGSAWISHPAALSLISEYQNNCDYIIVAAHGGLEQVPFSPIDRQILLRKFIDAGANLVIGHHPHVPQGWEKYNGGMIFHSIGNFIFDYPGKEKFPLSNWGYIVKITFNFKDLLKMEVFPTHQKNANIELIDEGENSEYIIKYLMRLSAIIINRNLYEKFWQELAVKLFFERYLQTYRKSLKISSLNNFILILCRKLIELEWFFKQPNMIIPSTKIPIMLNLLRNESHYSVVCKALSVLGEYEKDMRSPEVSKELNSFLKLNKK